MDTVVLENCLNEYDFIKSKALGVFSSDKLPIVESFSKCLIANTDPSTKPGQHWIAIYVNEDGSAEIFDSYGIKPNKVFLNYLKKFKNWTFNNTRLQGALSTTCGQYCLGYLFFKCMGLKLSAFLEPFDNSDFHFNDHLVNDICSYYFELKNPIFSNIKLNQFCVSLGH